VTLQRQNYISILLQVGGSVLAAATQGTELLASEASNQQKFLNNNIDFLDRLQHLTIPTPKAQSIQLDISRYTHLVISKYRPA
jgi:hypothetical protein